MITEAQAWENGFQAHLRSCRFWEAREKRPPVPAEDLRRQFEEASRRVAWEAEVIARQISRDEAMETLAEGIARAVAFGPQDTRPIRHIHQHGPSLPTPSSVKLPARKRKVQPVDL